MIILIFIIIILLSFKNLEFPNFIEKLLNNTIFKIIILLFFIFYQNNISIQTALIFIIFYILILDQTYVTNSKKIFKKINI